MHLEKCACILDSAQVSSKMRIYPGKYACILEAAHISSKIGGIFVGSPQEMCRFSNLDIFKRKEIKISKNQWYIS